MEDWKDLLPLFCRLQHEDHLQTPITQPALASFQPANKIQQGHGGVRNKENFSSLSIPPENDFPL